jgi:hypothetical protein
MHKQVLARRRTCQISWQSLGEQLALTRTVSICKVIIAIWDTFGRNKIERLLGGLVYLALGRVCAYVPRSGQGGYTSKIYLPRIQLD